MAQSIHEDKIRGEIFLTEQEQYLCTAGNQQMERYLATGKVKKCFAVLSDRAIYCKGPCYVSRDRRRFQKKDTDFRLDLQEFKDMKYLERKSPVLLTLAFIFLLLGPLVLLLDLLTGFGDGIVLNPTLDAVILLLLSAICFMLYLIHQKDLLERAILWQRGSYVFYGVSENAKAWEELFLSRIR